MYRHNKDKVLPEGTDTMKRQIKKLKDISWYYAHQIDKWETWFIAALKTHPPADISKAVSCQAQFVVPLLVLKDHADFSTGRLEAMLPEADRPYHPQEPDTDRFAHVRNRFR